MYSLTFTSIACIITFVYCQSPEVTTTLGNIAGETITFKEDSYLGVNKKIDVYKGVPFAEPPVDDLRFEKPRPKQPWTGTLNATAFSPWCLQRAPPYIFGEDDCLYLNVYVPQSKPANAAVMLYIHGGAYTTGTGSSSLYSGIVLAATGDVIVVTINYRLHLYGFLTTGDDEYPGNMGLFDQLEALKWVNSNIAAFGGDPSRVTLFGESAGASSVDAHLFSKQSSDYFSNAILESGSSLAFWAYWEREEARNLTITIGEKVGCEYTDSKPFVACMKTVDPGVLITTTDEYFSHLLVPIFPGLGPVIDGVFLEKSPQDLLRNGEFKKNISILVGTNKDEGTISYLQIPEYQTLETPTVLKSKFLELIPTAFVLTDAAENPHILDAIVYEYTDWSLADDPDADYFDSGVRVTTDFWFACPSDQLQRAHVAAGNKVYVYVMSHVPTVSIYVLPWLMAGHSEDIQFVFGLAFLNGSSFIEYSSATDQNLSVKFMRYWTNFAKTGDPNTRGIESSDPQFDEDLTVWPRYTVPALEYLDINPMSSIGRAYRADQCAFWNSYEPKLEQFTADLSDTEESWRRDYYTWKFNDLPEWQKTFGEYSQNKYCD